MLNLLSLIASLVAGTLLGYFLRKKRVPKLGKITFGVILALMFSLGFSMGSNNELLDLLPRIGLNAFVILALSILFSVVFVEAAVKVVKMK